MLTGVPDPRAMRRCLPQVRALVDDWDVVFFAVYREEFDGPRVREALLSECGDVTFVVVPAVATARMLESVDGDWTTRTMRQMWHEIEAGEACIRRSGAFDAVLRSRYDVFWAPQRLPDLPGDREVIVPDQLSWSGTNDMVALAGCDAFRRYAATGSLLNDASAQVNSGVPELLLTRCLLLSGVEPVERPLRFVLLRPQIADELTDSQLASLAWIHPPTSVTRPEAPDAVQEILDHVRVALNRDDRWPIHGDSFRVGMGLDGVETDVTDGASFRWMGHHAYFFRKIPKETRGLRFVLHAQIEGVDMVKSSVAVNGAPCALRTARDDHGRVVLHADLAPGWKPRIPLDKVSLAFREAARPCDLDPSNTDTRTLSVALGAPTLY
jgi:hypothetical protein